MTVPPINENKKTSTKGIHLLQRTIYTALPPQIRVIKDPLFACELSTPYNVGNVPSL